MSSSCKLVKASRRGDLASVNRSLRRFAGRPVNKILALIAAAEAGHTVIVTRLLSTGVYINAMNNRGQTALHCASIHGHHCVVETLVAAGADVNVVDGCGFTVHPVGCTALMLASSKGHVSVVQELLRAGADITIADSDGDTALALATRNGHDAIVQLLVAAGNAVGDHDPEQRDDESFFRSFAASDPDLQEAFELLDAARAGDSRLVERCLSRSVDCAQTVLQDLPSPLIEASKRGYDGIIQKLLSVQVPLNLTDAKGRTALHYASEAGHHGIVVALLAAGSDVNLVDHDGHTALTDASYNGHVDVIRSLLQVGADVTHVFVGWTALMLASVRGQVEAVKELIRAKSDVNYADSDGDTPLVVAAIGSHATVVEMLITAGAKVHHTTKFGATALLQAARGGAVESVSTLIRAGANVNHVQCDGTTSLLFASYGGFASVVEMLLAAGATVDHVDNDGDTALGLAAAAGHVDTARVLLNAGASVTIKNKSGLTPLEIASTNGHGQVVSLLENFDPSVSNVFACIARGDIEELRRVFDQHKNARDEHDRTLLHLATKHCRREIVQLLVFRGASVHDRDRSGWTPLHYGAQSGDVRVLTFLLAQGCQVDIIDADGLSPVLVAARHGRIDIVRELRRHGADPSLLSFDGRNILHLSAERKDSESIVEYLLATSATPADYINARDNEQSSPLHYAVRAANEAAIGTLISRGADIDAQDQVGETPLMIACRRGSSSIVRTLLAEGAKTDLVSVAGETAHSTAQSVEIQSVVELYHTSQQFHQRCGALLSAVDTKPTSSDLKELVPLITSAFDLRLLLSVLSLAFDDEPANHCAARDALLHTALRHVIDAKLVFDDNACVFFKLVLEHCAKKKWLTKHDLGMLDRQAEKANNENADWVLELQRKVHDHSWRLDAQQQSLKSIVGGINQLYGMILDNREAITNVHKQVVHVKSRLESAVQLVGVLHTRTQHLEAEAVKGRQIVSQLVHQGNRITDRVQQLQKRLVQSENAVRDRLMLHESSLRAVAQDLDSFRNTYNARIMQEARNAKIKSYGGIVASIAGFVLAPVLSTAFSSFIDLTNPVDVYTAAFTDSSTTKLAGFLASAANECVLKPLVADQFEKLMIPKDEFAMVLREGIALQHPELLRGGHGVDTGGLGFVGTVDDAKALQASLENDSVAVDALLVDLESTLKACEMGLPTQRLKQPQIPIWPSSSPSPHHTPQRQQAVVLSGHVSKIPVDEISDQVQARKTTNGDVQPTAHTSQASATGKAASPSTDDSETPGEEVVFDADAFPFHVAVRESHGQLNVFCELYDVLAGDNDDPSAVAEMLLQSACQSPESLCAAEYAYSLGYHRVGDYLVALMKKTGVATHVNATSQAPNVVLLQDEADFVYIHIVNQCAGDADECEDMCEAIEGDDFAIDARIQANVTRENSAHVRWMAVEYAAHLGYIDIVKYLMKRQRLPAMTKIQLLKQAKERARAVKANA